MDTDLAAAARYRFPCIMHNATCTMHERVSDRNCGRSAHAIVLCSSLFSFCGGSHPDFAATSARPFHRAARERERTARLSPKPHLVRPACVRSGERPSIAKLSLALFLLHSHPLVDRLHCTQSKQGIATLAQSRTRPHGDNRCFPSFGESRKNQSKNQNKNNTKFQFEPK